MAANSNSSNSLWGFLVKILVLSTLISAAIKYLGPLLHLPITNGIALTLVLSPTVIMSVALAFRANQS
jgi:hypothetical protein